MSARSAVITLVNHTNFDWAFKSAKDKHGKFDGKPNPHSDEEGHHFFPERIPAQGSVTFTVCNRSGAMIGPEGWVEYYVLDDIKPINTVMRCRFDHPYDKGPSYYLAEFDHTEDDAYEFLGQGTLEPSHPSGHHQKVTLTVTGKQIAKQQSKAS
ncbi:hypothetical protein GCM10011297_03160 [Bacterioplanes sanyensis]|uniref:aegerolysin family protein n=1 Tax=Bacterioplanes sanyensis TaxID=1249553 RepID=UPI00167A810C|nr:aegerolysin family protein [Bacterioplanes sanyensis]GGY33545.1 hypothetical protein GCM10011297_03160 [Bacterioplanes sanyensis]